jgi:cob(I)alamin adenosyltransferase
MVRINRVTTRGGDKGETSLGDGSRVPKTDPRIEAVGDVDELNASIGVLRTRTVQNRNADAMLARIQNDLFDLGAELCMPGSSARLTLSENATARLEAELVAMNGNLLPLNSFILPGGTTEAAFAHVARATARRAERSVLSVPDSSAEVRRYLNRLSDHLFVLARVLNDNAAQDVLWVPGASRTTDGA